MKVSVRYMAQVRQAAGVPSEEVELEGPCTLHELIARLVGRHGGAFRQLLMDDSGGMQATILFFVGDEQVGPADGRALRDGDVVTVLSPIAGG
jgi:molybdopterin converting factor small subunit